MALDLRLVIDALPNYEIGEEVGRGGWGVVLSGRHRELGRSVAIKQLPRAFAADPAVRSRFKDEARLIASLDHPHIVPVYDFVESEGLCLIVMELMPDGTLWDRFTGPGLPIDQACGLMLSASVALHFAHGRGIMHRDVKPENFLFSASGVMKLGDFGIAKLLDASGGGHTLTGQIIGTPAYMAPEQASAGVVGPHTDVYACSVMLYELLTGELPFIETREPLGQLMQRLTQPPRPITETRPDVPRDIALTVMKGLERDVGQRYASALEFGESLARAATIAFGPGWLIRSGVEVLGAQGIVAITSTPVAGESGEVPAAGPTAGRTVRPTMSHLRLDELMALDPSGLQPAGPDTHLAQTPAPSPRMAEPAPAPPPRAPNPAPSQPSTRESRTTTPFPQAHTTPAPPPQSPQVEPLPNQHFTPTPVPEQPVVMQGQPQATVGPGLEAHAPGTDAGAHAGAHAATVGAPRTPGPPDGGDDGLRLPGPQHPGDQPPEPYGRPAESPASTRKPSAIVATLAVVIALFVAGVFLIARSRITPSMVGSPTGQSDTSIPGGGPRPKIDSIADGADNTKVVTWQDPEGLGPHYLYAIGENFSNLVATEQSPTTVALPASGGVCFVLTRQDSSQKSLPSCTPGTSADIIPPDLH